MDLRVIKMKKLVALVFFLFISGMAVFAWTRNSYTQYGKHIMPNEYDPYFIDNIEHCTPNEYVDWTGTYKYVIEGKEGNICKYKSRYNEWLKNKNNEWKDYKVCGFDDIKLRELSKTLKEHSGQIKSYNLVPYKTTGTKLEYLLYSYEYYGACKLILKK